MRILGIETSGDTSSVALCEDGQVVAEKVFASRRTICQLLTRQILAVLGTETVLAAKLDGVAASIGPASFTGLRVGVATAKALAYCCRIPVVGISTPLAWAAGTEGKEPGTIIMVLQPARRGRFYLTVFDETQERWPRQRDETQVVDEHSLLGAATALSQQSRLVVTGDALLAEPELRDALGECAGVLLALADCPRASLVARLAADEIANAAPDSYFTLRPHYVLVSQAERTHGVDLGL